MSHFTCVSALSGVISATSVIGEFRGRLQDRSQEARKHVLSHTLLPHGATLPCSLGVCQLSLAALMVRPVVLKGMTVRDV